MTVVNTEHRWEAPGRLELVRALLNTRLPDPAHPRADRLPGLAADPGAWADAFPGTAPPDAAGVQALVELRDGLRGLLGGAASADQAAWLTGWARRVGLSVVLAAEEGRLTARHECAADGLAAAVVQAVVAAVADGSWAKLKQCPDCRLAFFDHSRNASKVWCGMYAGADGRACGTIAKVRRYRARRAAR
jgi:predicted RNA-binding Zn ribbon-like protein